MWAVIGKGHMEGFWSAGNEVFLNLGNDLPILG